MKTEILYVELKQGHSGPAWIGFGQFSKSGQTVYFNGKVLKKSQGISGNHLDIENQDEYWVSGVKKNGEDRHWAGSGKVHIDRSAIADYLKLIGQTALPKNKFIETDLDNVPNKALANDIENSKLEEHPFDESLKFKNVKDLHFDELKQVIKFYTEAIPETPDLKARKMFREKLDEALEEVELRLSQL